MGNAETGFMVIFALIAGVVGAGSCLSGIQHIMSWKHESLVAASGAMTAWSLTLLAMGYVYLIYFYAIFSFGLVFLEDDALPKRKKPPGAPEEGNQNIEIPTQSIGPY